MPVIANTVINSDKSVSTIYIEVDEAQVINPAEPFAGTQTTSKSTGDRDTGNPFETPRLLNPFADTRDAEQVVGNAFNKGMDLIRTCSEQIMMTIQKIDQTTRPTDFEVVLSIKLDSQVGAILARTSAEAQLQVTLKWSKKESHEQ